MNKRQVAVALVATSTVALSACGSSSTSSSAGSSATAAPNCGSGSTITVGLLSPLTGAFATVGTGFQQGLQIAFDAANSKGGVCGGKQLSIDTADEALKDPTVSTAAIRKFANAGDKIVVGAALSQDCIASSPVAAQLKMLDISPGCAVAQLIGPNRLSKTFFSSAGNDAMQVYGLQKLLVDKFPSVMSLWTVNYDYVTGHELSTGLRASYGKKVSGLTGQDLFAPLGASDYSSVISTLASQATGDAGSQALVLTNYGSGALTFLKQAGQAGLLSHFGFIGTIYEYYAAAKAFNGASPKVWDAYVYPHHQIFNSAANQAFVSAYQAAAKGAYPNDYGYSGYITGLAIVQAIQKTNSLDLQALSSALEGMTVNGPAGSFTIDGASHHFLVPEVLALMGGDPSAPEGVKLYDSEVIPGTEANSVPIGG